MTSTVAHCMCVWGVGCGGSCGGGGLLAGVGTLTIGPASLLGPTAPSMTVRRGAVERGGNPGMGVISCAWFGGGQQCTKPNNKSSSSSR
jgi:hypothetical protein